MSFCITVFQQSQHLRLNFRFLSFFLMSDFYFSLSGNFIIGFSGPPHSHQKQRTCWSWWCPGYSFYLMAFWFIVGYFELSSVVRRVWHQKRMTPLCRLHQQSYPRRISTISLAVVYAICIIFIFSLCYIVKKIRPERGMAVGLASAPLGIMWFIGSGGRRIKW